MPLHQCGQLHGSWTQRSGYILQTAIMGKWLLSDLVIWKIIKKRNFSKDKYAPTGKVVKSKFSLFYLCFSLTFHTKRIEQRQYFTLSSTWYLTETSTMQINSERGELWKRWGVLRATDFETSVVSQEQSFLRQAETLWPGIWECMNSWSQCSPNNKEWEEAKTCLTLF